MANKKKKNNKDIKKEKYIKIGIILVTLIFIFIIYKIFDIVVTQNEKIDLSGETYYQYFYGVRSEYSGEMEIVKTENSTQLVLEDNKVVLLDSTPIYYKDILGKVLFSNKMEVVYPSTGNVYRLDNYTNLIQENKNIYAKRFKKDDRKRLDDAFIFDGNDLYFFLEETTITIGKQKYKVSPLSYVIVNYRQNVEIYDYDKDEYTILDESQLSSSDVIATNKNKDYTINLSVDSFSTGLSDQLLIKNIDRLSELDY